MERLLSLIAACALLSFIFYLPKGSPKMLRILTTAAMTTALLFAPAANASELSNTTPTTGSNSGSALFGSAEGWGYGSIALSPGQSEYKLTQKGYNEKDATAIAWGSISPDHTCPPPPPPGVPHTDMVRICPGVPVTIGEWLSAIFHHLTVLLGLAEPTR